MDNNTKLNSDRFLDAYASIERRLYELAKRKRGEATFYSLVDEVSKSNSAVRQFKNDLKEYADLRNAIIHERSDNRVIAEPNDKAVKDIEQLASIISDPPKVIPKFQKPVFKLSIEDSIAEAVKVMYIHRFSQIPIYRAEKFAALLTTNTISRWLGAKVEEEIFSVETSIAQVLDYTEDENNYRFFARNKTLFDVVQSFQDFAINGKRLEAILITDSGNNNEALLGIVTIHDLPDVQRELRLHSD